MALLAPARRAERVARQPARLLCLLLPQRFRLHLRSILDCMRIYSTARLRIRRPHRLQHQRVVSPGDSVRLRVQVQELRLRLPLQLLDAAVAASRNKKPGLRPAPVLRFL